PTEQCDDGANNGTTASCCSTACTFQPAATPCAGGTCSGSANTCAPATTSTTLGSGGTMTTTTLAPAGTTTSSTLRCTTARCNLDAVLSGPTCSGEAVPTRITKKLNQAESLIEKAGGSQQKKAKRLLKQAK